MKPLLATHEANGPEEAIGSPSEPKKRLLPHHERELCEGSGLTMETIRMAGIYTESNKVTQAAILNWSSKNGKQSDAIVFPMLRPDGTSSYSRLKFDTPRKRKDKSDRDAAAPKYESPKNSLVEAYFPRGENWLQIATDPRQEICFTEGEKKSLKATQELLPTIGLTGVWGFRPKNQTVLLPELEMFVWAGRSVFIAFDSDCEHKQSVSKAEATLAAALTARGAKVRSVRIPPAGFTDADEPIKQGIDDFLVAAGADCKREFRKLLDAAVDPPAPTTDDDRPSARSLDPAVEAAQIIADMTTDGVCWLRFHRDDWHRHTAGRYAVVPPSEIRAEVVRVLNRRCHHLTSGVVGNVLDQLRSQTILSCGHSAPCWLKRPEGIDWMPHEVISCKNWLLHLPTFVIDPERGVIPATPRFFTPAAIDFDFDFDAPDPTRWLAFLRQLWQDEESITLLQQWMGYLLTCDTRQQKMLWLVGPKRSGKSTITRITSALVGESNVCSPTFGSLATEFGLQPLLAKTLAIIDDARLSGRTDQAIVTERLLQVTGEGSPTINRKHQPQITTKLPVRFMVTTNELPRLSDASGALSGRMLILKTTRSFYDRENIGLTDQLMQERPGILRWAIEGWKCLQQSGRFVQPSAGAALRRKMDDIASPVAAFVRERCELRSDFDVPKESLYLAFRGWCTAFGINTMAEPHFGRDLFAAFGEIEECRPRREGARVQSYRGIRLAAEFAQTNSDAAG